MANIARVYDIRMQACGTDQPQELAYHVTMPWGKFIIRVIARLEWNQLNNSRPKWIIALQSVISIHAGDPKSFSGEHQQWTQWIWIIDLMCQPIDSTYIQSVLEQDVLIIIPLHFYTILRHYGVWLSFSIGAPPDAHISIRTQSIQTHWSRNFSSIAHDKYTIACEQRFAIQWQSDSRLPEPKTTRNNQ